MQRRRSVIAAMGLSLAFLGVVACAPVVNTHGYAPTDVDLAELQVNVDTRDTVESIVGRPSTTGVMDESGWYYVKSEFRDFGWRESEEISREVVAILFDDVGVVQNIERFGIENGRIVALSRRVSNDNTAGVSFLQQLFGNIGNFNPGQFLGG